MGLLQIEWLVLGALQTNCYLAKNKETGALLIVDPGDQPKRVIDKVQAMSGKPEAILLTHGHFDHIGGAVTLRDTYGIPICALDKEQEILENPDKNLSVMMGPGYGINADRYFHDGETVTLAGVQIQVIHTPGHTSGGACYYLESEHLLFSGDTLFRCSVGRSDFPTGSMRQLHDSVHDKLFVLPEDTLVLPGHNSATDIAYEKRYNPY